MQRSSSQRSKVSQHGLHTAPQQTSLINWAHVGDMSQINPSFVPKYKQVWLSYHAGFMTTFLKSLCQVSLISHRWAPDQHVAISHRLSWLGSKSLVIAVSITHDNTILWVHKSLLSCIPNSIPCWIQSVKAFFVNRAWIQTSPQRNFLSSIFHHINGYQS